MDEDIWYLKPDVPEALVTLMEHRIEGIKRFPETGVYGMGTTSKQARHEVRILLAESFKENRLIYTIPEKAGDFIHGRIIWY